MDNTNPPFYQIRKFDVAELSEGTWYVMSDAGGYVFDDRRFINALHSLGEISSRPQPKERIFSQISSSCGSISVSKDIYNIFDKTLKLFVKSLPHDSYTLKGIIIYHDEIDEIDCLRHSLEEITPLPISTRCIADMDSHYNCFIIVILKSYTPSIVQRIYTACGQSNVYLTSYFYHDNFMIDSPYSFASGLPCHYCRFLSLEDEIEQPRLMNNASAKRWGNFMRRLGNFRQDAAFNVERNRIDYFGALYTLYFAARMSLDYFIYPSHQEQLRNSYTLRLASGQLYDSYVVHHPMCRCIGSE